MQFFVYLHTSTVTGKSYVGLTKEAVEVRFRVHCQRALLNDSQVKFHRAIRKHGRDAWRTDVLHVVDSWKEAARLEREEIAARDTFRRGYNMTLGGEGTLGMPMSVENRERLSAEFRMRWQEENYRARMATLNAGYKHDEASKAKRSAKLKGREITPDWRQKLSAAVVGKKRGSQAAETQDRKRAKLNQTWEVTHPCGRIEVISGLKGWCAQMGLSYQCLSQAGRTKGFAAKKSSPC